ncbi:hypothetical protein PFISCL1PPCAC_19085, partial [Pristionchus fissidentatus]
MGNHCVFVSKKRNICTEIFIIVEILTTLSKWWIRACSVSAPITSANWASASHFALASTTILQIARHHACNIRCLTPNNSIVHSSTRCQNQIRLCCHCEKGKGNAEKHDLHSRQ